jgi:hypothetical protein
LAPIVSAAVLPDSEPFGESTVAAASALRTSSMVMPMPARVCGSTCTRTAGCCEPPTVT